LIKIERLSVETNIIRGKMSCPQTALSILDLQTFTACIITYQLDKSAETVQQYFNTGADRQCLAEKGGCSKVKSYLGCKKTTAVVIKDISNYQGDATTNCQSLFVHDKKEYCDMAFGDLLNYYCVPPPILTDGQIVGIIVGSIAFTIFLLYVCYRLKLSHDLEREIEAAVGGLPPGAVLKPPPGLGPPSPNNLMGSGGGGGGATNSNSPYMNMNGMQHMPVNEIKFLGVRPSANPQAHTYDAFCYIPSLGREEWLGTFNTQEEAARVYDARVWQLRQAGQSYAPMNWEPEQVGKVPRFAGGGGGGGNNNKSTHHHHHHQQHNNNNNPSKLDKQGFNQIMQGNIQTQKQQQHLQQKSTRVRTWGSGYNAEDPVVVQRHKEELIFFYRYYDETKPNIEQTVENLFSKYTFLGIARAVRNKYGILPNGWVEECERLKSHNFSERVSRLFGFAGYGPPVPAANNNYGGGMGEGGIVVGNYPPVQVSGGGGGSGGNQSTQLAAAAAAGRGIQPTQQQDVVPNF
jgi:hypothetical protein